MKRDPQLVNPTSPSPAQGTDHVVNLRELSIHYRTWGNPKHEPVVLVHGLNTECHQWDPVAAMLSDDFFVICPDLRGHGLSSWATEDGYHLDNFVLDLHALAERLSLFPFHFVGHSLGARIGIAYGGERSSTLRTLTLSDSGPEISPHAARLIKDRQLKIVNKRGFRDEPEALNFIRELQPDWQPVFHELYVRHQLRQNWAGKLVQRADPELIWMTGSIGLKDVPRLWTMASQIAVPTLIMWGRRSEVMDRDLAERLQQAIPNSELATFETGHYIPREQPQRFAEALREFISAHRRT